MNTKKHLVVAALILVITGFCILISVNWKIAVGVFLLLWAFNIESKL